MKRMNVPEGFLLFDTCVAKARDSPLQSLGSLRAQLLSMNMTLSMKSSSVHFQKQSWMHMCSWIAKLHIIRH